MVLNCRVADSSSHEDETKLRSRQRLVEPARRWNASGQRDGVVGVSTSAARLPTASPEPTTHQKVRKIAEEHQTWRDRTRSHLAKQATVLPNYSIIASRGELSRERSFPLRESPSRDCRRRSPGASDDLRGSREQKNPWERRRDLGERSGSRSRCLRNKSPSVSANLKDSLERSSDNGILKRSSVLLSKIAKDRSEEVRPSQFKKRNPAVSTSRVQSVVASYLRKSPSCQTLAPTSDRDLRGGRAVKKSVSFSVDTSFASKSSPFAKNTIHEARVYRKGVLRDINDLERKKKLPQLEETMTQVLLRAAREADELMLTDVLAKIRRSGDYDQIEVNARDTSGRSAISYIAGNGAAEILEIVLSIPGADPNLPDNEGNTPLHFAAQAGQAECLNTLLKRGPRIEIDARNVLGFTPLMKAALQGRTKCAKILLFAGANPALRDHGRGLKADLWARFCGRHGCADVIERFSRHKFMERTACRWGSEPELATKVLQGKIIPVPMVPMPVVSSGIKSKIKRVFKASNSDRSFSLVSQLTSAALCASTPALPKPGDMPPVKSLIRPLSVPQLRVTLAAASDTMENSLEINIIENLDIAKPPRVKKKNK